MKCDSCSADVSPASTQCEFCGSYVVRTVAIILERPAETEPTPPQAETPRPPKLSPGARLSQLKASDEYQALLAGREIDACPIPTALYSLMVMWWVGFTFFALTAIGFSFVSIPFAIFPASVAIGYLWMATKFLKVVQSFFASSAIPIPAIIVEMEILPATMKRATAESYVTFQTDVEHFERYRIWDASFYNRLELGDAGFLICRDGIAVDFFARPV